MRVTLTCSTNTWKPGIVYATVADGAGQIIMSATLDYCLSACHERGNIIENAQDVLMWLHLNVEFEAY